MSAWHEAEVYRYIMLAKKEVMAPVKRAKLGVMVLLAIMIAFTMYILAQPPSYWIFAVIGNFLMLIIAGPYIALYLSIKKRSANVIEMINRGDLIAAIRTLEMLQTKTLLLAPLLTSHYAAAKGYLEQALASIAKEKRR